MSPPSAGSRAERQPDATSRFLCSDRIQRCRIETQRPENCRCDLRKSCYVGDRLLSEAGKREHQDDVGIVVPKPAVISDHRRVVKDGCRLNGAQAEKSV